MGGVTLLRHLMATALAASCVLGGVARADQDDPALDPLFAQLRVAKSPEEARYIEHAIADLWAKSDSDAIDYLMHSGLAALGSHDYRSALSMFSSVTQIAPGFAEGWSKRATAHYLLGDARSAVISLEHVLALEPRHFDALFGLAGIFEDWGDKKRALAALSAAHAIDPHLEGTADRIRELGREVGGRGI